MKRYGEPRRTMRMTASVYREIRTEIGQHRAERGAMLGSNADGVICRIEVDHGARTGSAEYSPDHVHLNKVIKQWKAEGIRFVGFVHSHPGLREPSHADIEYSERILEHFEELELLWLPIVQTIPNVGKFELRPFASVRQMNQGEGAHVEAARLSILDEIAEISSARRPHESLAPGTSLVETSSADDRFARIRNGFDLERHARTRLVFIGTGGSASLILNCARTGFKDFALIDPQTLEAPNIASQHANPASLGMAKVDALGDEIRLINPSATVRPIARPIEDIPDAEFERLLFDPESLGRRSPEIVVLLPLTDNFAAQARGHRLGLQFGIPTICAQEYQGGRGAEITYTVPGMTSACQRCITSSRYRAYLEEGYQNDVSSEGAPVFAADFLNSAIAHVLLAVVYHGTDHPRFGKFIEEFGNRNLIQLRMDPSFRLARGGGDGPYSLMLDSVFLPQSPDSGQSPSRPTCPDCGGIGDLRLVAGSFADTRVMRIPQDAPLLRDTI
jgi:proteasome lid subunit RPN8/RPN11